MAQPLPVLSQMPWHIKEEIANSADNATKCALKNSCKEMRSMLANSEIHYDCLELQTTFEKHLIKICRNLHGNLESVEFYRHENGYSKKVGDVETEVAGGNYFTGAVAQIMKTLRDPRSVIKRLVIDFGCPGYIRYPYDKNQTLMMTLTEALSSLPSQLQVVQFLMKNNRNANEILDIIQFLKPKTLSAIMFSPKEIHPSNELCHINLTEVAKTEQWKQAKKLALMKYTLSLPALETNHFECIGYSTQSLSQQKVMNLIEEVSTTNRYAHALNLKEISSDVWDFLSEFPKVTRNNSDVYEIRRPGEPTCWMVINEARKLVTFRKDIF